MGKIFKIAGILLVLLIVIFAGTHFYIKHRFHDFIQNDLVEGKVTVSDLSINLFTGSFTAKGLQTVDSTMSRMNFILDKIEVSGVDYIKAFSTDTLMINRFEMDGYEFRFRESGSSESSTTQNDSLNRGNSGSNRVLAIQKIRVADGRLSSYSGSNKTFYTEVNKMHLIEVVFPVEKPVNNLSYSIDQIDIDSVFVKLNKRENIHLGHLMVHQDSINMKNLKLVTNDSVQQLVRDNKINYDILKLNVPELAVSKYGFDISSSKRFEAKQVAINQPVFTATANNNLESTGPSPTYHEMLRNLGVELLVDEISIKNGQVEYSEPHAEKDRRGSIVFDQLNGSIESFSNLKESQPIKLDATSRFMKDSKVNVELTMDVYSEKDSFTVKADIHNLDLGSVNSFTRPVLDMELRGTVNDYYFTLQGQEKIGYITTRIAYSNFDVKMMTPGGNSKWLVNSLAGVILKKNAKKPVEQKTELTRDRSKTPFNFIWKIQEKALRKIVL